MTLKKKMIVSYLLLLAIILGLIGLGFGLLTHQTQNTQRLLSENYDSVIASQEMIKDLEAISAGDTSHRASFKENLKFESENITEAGEQALVTQLTAAYQKEDYSQSLSICHQILRLNLEAITRKDQLAIQSGKQLLSIMIATGVLSILLTLTIMIFFLKRIMKPLRELKQKMTAIGDQNYEERISDQTPDEIGVLSREYNKMAAKLQSYSDSNTAKLQEKNMLLNTIIQNLNDGLIVLNTSETICLTNTLAEKILGKNNPESMLKHMENGSELRIFLDDKEHIFVSEHHHLENTGTLIILKDITHFKTLDQAKTQFMATISHELRTPFSAIKMSLKLIEDERIGTLNSEQLQLLKEIQKEITRLTSITNELLDLSQLETGNIQLHITPCTAQTIAQNAIEALSLQAKQKDIQLMPLFDDSQKNIKADPEKSTWILVNLIGNAIRYSPENGEIKIKLWQQNDAVIFSVSDQGPGISQENIAKLFVRYSRLDEGRGLSGSGLGLAIAKEFTEAQGGKIWAESELGKGSQFYVSFPCY